MRFHTHTSIAWERQSHIFCPEVPQYIDLAEHNHVQVFRLHVVQPIRVRRICLAVCSAPFCGIIVCQTTDAPCLSDRDRQTAEWISGQSASGNPIRDFRELKPDVLAAAHVFPDMRRVSNTLSL